MDLTSLKRWRLLIPGFLMLVLSKVVIATSFSEIPSISVFLKQFNVSLVYYLIPVAAFGIAYYSLDIRCFCGKGLMTKS